MVRVYKPNPHEKTYKNHPKEVINAALEDINDGMSFRKAAEKHEISKSVLHRLQKRGNKLLKQGV